MKEDLEYRSLIHRYERHNQDNSLEMVTEGEVEETRGHARKAIHTIQQKMTRRHDDVSDQLDITMMKMFIGKIEMVEVYSPPRVTEVVRKMGIKVDWSFDITNHDSDGKMWKFNKVEMRNGAVHRIIKDEPLLTIGNPMCTAFRVMNNLYYAKMSKEEVDNRMAYGREHL